MIGTNNRFRVFVDTNVLISAIHRPESVSARFLQLLSTKHNLLLCSFSLTEVSKVIASRTPEMIAEWDRVLSGLQFELVQTPSPPLTFSVPFIRDPNDIPILVSAVLAAPDILVVRFINSLTKLAKNMV